MGRPQSDDPKDVYTQIRQTRAEKARWRKAARMQGMKLTEFIRAAVEKFASQQQKDRK